MSTQPMTPYPYIPSFSIPAPSAGLCHPLDPLEYLPTSQILHFRRNAAIYSPTDTPPGLCLVMEGMASVSILSPAGRSTIVNIHKKDDLFGESSLLQLRPLPALTAPPAEFARAISDCRIMLWPSARIHSLCLDRPLLAVSLLHLSIRRTVSLIDRIVSLSTDDIPRRLARTLLYLGEHLGTDALNGTRYPDRRFIPGMSHEKLAQSIGTSRELVTHHMGILRSLCLIKYDRRVITIYPRDIELYLG